MVVNCTRRFAERQMSGSYRILDDVERLKLLPVVKAYPVVDQTSASEAVCVACITVDPPHRWVRLFPLDFRGLASPQKFRKYEVIELDAARHTKDPRPESRQPILESIVTREHLDTDNGSWDRRLRLIDAVEDESMCAIYEAQRDNRQSLGVFRPARIDDLTVTVVPAEFAARQKAVIDQASLFGGRTGDTDRNTLEPLPVKAVFHYECSSPGCKGHHQSLIDWELGALFRGLRDQDDEQTALRKVRDKFLAYCGPKYDVRFFTGSMLSKPTSFLILGLVHPKRKPLTLF